MDFVNYVVGKFNQEADPSDKIKVNILTSISTILNTTFSVLGFVTLFDISRDSFWAFFLLGFFGYNYLNVFRFWHIGRTMVGLIEPPEKKAEGLTSGRKRSIIKI